jgi:hypothetical protein
MKIVNSLSESNEFYIFRRDGTEVKCYIDNFKIVRSIKYKLTLEEIELIKNTYITNDVKKIAIKKTHYINLLKNS